MVDLAVEIALRRHTRATLTSQLIEGIRRLIRAGRLVEGDRLPSTREGAAALGVSRNVVAEAYDQLAAEGYLEARVGSGSYVAPGLQASLSIVARPAERRVGPPRPLPTPSLRFNAGNPDLRSFPVGAWADSLKRAALRSRERDLGYRSIMGLRELREALSGCLLRQRGIRCDPRLILIVSGITQAVDLLAKGFPPDDRREAIVEDPSLEFVQRAFILNGYRLRPVAVDEAGLRTAELPAESRARFVCVVPSHQYPLGGILPVQRRAALVEFARRKGVWILEDDYDSEFRYQGAPVEPLQLLAPERVVYFGTFSKTMFPALRLAYLVLPEELLSPLVEVKKGLNLFSPTIEQAALAEWITSGRYDAHVYRMKRLYRRKRERVVRAVEACFGASARVLGQSAGLHLLLELTARELDGATIERLRSAGLEIDWVEESAVRKGGHRGQIVIGYGNLSEEEIEAGVRRLAELLG